MRRILLVIIGLSTTLFADFSRTGDIVTDTTTGLQWQDNEVVARNWSGAIDYCETLSFDGHDDWRLPNIKELTSLVDDSKINPAIKHGVFQYADVGDDWSSTTNMDSNNSAWYVPFDRGYQRIGNKSDGYYVRCVRAGE